MSTNKTTWTKFTVRLHVIHELGFKAIRITLECNPEDYNDTQNQKTNMFFSATDNYGLAVALVIQNLVDYDKVDYYLNRWGSHLKYIQVQMNQNYRPHGP